MSVFSGEQQEVLEMSLSGDGISELRVLLSTDGSALVKPVCAHARRSASPDESVGRHVGNAPAPGRYDA